MAERSPHSTASTSGRAWRLAAWTLSGFVLTGTVAVVWLFNTDLGVFKPQIERYVSQSTGREFRIGGELTVRLGSTTTVLAERVTLGNAPWAGSANMLNIGRLETRFKLWSLFGRPVIELIDIDDAGIQLMRSETGAANWSFDRGNEQPADRKNGDGGPPPLVRRIEIDRLELDYVNPNRAQPVVLELDAVRQQLRTDGMLELDLGGTLGGRSIGARGEIGTWTALLQQADVTFELRGHLGNVEFDANGRIDDLRQPSRPTIRYRLSGPDIDELTQMLGAGDEGLGDIELTGSLLPQADGALVLDVNGNLGENRIEASGSAADLRSLDALDIDLAANGPDLARVLRWLGIQNADGAPYSLELRAGRRGNGLTVERATLQYGEASVALTATLPEFPGLDDADVELRISGSDVGRFRRLFELPGAASGPFALTLDVGMLPSGEGAIRGRLDTSLLAATVAGTLGAGHGYIGTALDVDVRAPDAESVGAAWDLPGLLPVPLTARGRIEYTKDGIEMRNPFLVTYGDATARIAGTVVPHGALEGTNLILDLTVPDLAGLLSTLDTALELPALPATLNGELRVASDRLRLTEVRGQVGRSQLRLSGDLFHRNRLVGSTLLVDASGPALEELVRHADHFRLAGGSFDLSFRIGLEDDALLVDDLDISRERGSVSGRIEIGLPLSAAHARFDVRGKGADVRQLLERVGSFQANELPYSLLATGEWRSNSLSLQRLETAIGRATAEASGTLHWGDKAGTTAFSFDGNVHSLAELGSIGGNPLSDQPLALRGRIAGNRDAAELEDFAATIGDSDVQGRVSYRAGDVPSIDIRIFADAIDMQPLLQTSEAASEPVAVTDGRLIPDVAIPFERMQEIDATLRVDIGRFSRKSLVLADIDIEAALTGGRLDVPKLGFDGRSGRLEARLTLDPAGGEGKLSAELVARRFALGMGEMNRDLARTSDLDVKVTSTGRDLRALLGNLNGVAILDSRGGRFANNRFLQAVYGDLLQEIIGTINPFYRANTAMNLECIVVPYSIANGRLRGTPNAIIRTEKVQIVSQGRVDLNDESLDVSFRTRPRSGMTISAGELVNPYVKVVGTLANPELAVDEQGVLLSGGAAVATGGLSILAKAVWDRLARSPDPCGEVAAEAQELLGDRLPDWRASVSADSENPPVTPP